MVTIFSAPPSPGATPARCLPRQALELLLFEPVVPLRYNQDGFQALQASEWQDMTAEKDSYVGVSAMSSAPSQTVAGDGDAIIEDTIIDDLPGSVSSGELDDSSSSVLEENDAADPSEASDDDLGLCLQLPQ
jgi:hypothetical protein